MQILSKRLLSVVPPLHHDAHGNVLLGVLPITRRDKNESPHTQHVLKRPKRKNPIEWPIEVAIEPNGKNKRRFRLEFGRFHLPSVSCAAAASRGLPRANCKLALHHRGSRERQLAQIRTARTASTAPWQSLVSA